MEDMENMEENEYKKIELPKNDRLEIILVTKRNGERTKYENPQQACQIFKDILEFDYCVGLRYFKHMIASPKYHY